MELDRTNIPGLSENFNHMYALYFCIDADKLNCKNL